MPITISTRTDTRQLDAYLGYIQATPQVIQTVAETNVLPVAQAYADLELKPYPPPIQPGYFKALATPKQRRYVMRRIRLGLWTGRTGALKKAWRTVYAALPDGAQIAIGNMAAKAQYIIWRYQQPFLIHWIRFDYQQPVILKKLNDAFLKHWQRGLLERLRK